jgi:hypothetical protein
MMRSGIVVSVLAVAAAVAAVALLAFPAKVSNEKSPRRLGETAKYIVTFADRDIAPGDRCYALAEARGGSVAAVYEEVNACSLTLPRAEVGAEVQDEIAALSDPSVIFEEDGKVYAWDTEEGDELYSLSAHRRTQQATSLWGLDRIDGCSLSYDNTKTPQDGSNVAVFIVDTGIRGTHNEFNGMIGPTNCHFSAFTTDPLADGNGHG